MMSTPQDRDRSPTARITAAVLDSIDGMIHAARIANTTASAMRRMLCQRRARSILVKKDCMNSALGKVSCALAKRATRVSSISLDIRVTVGLQQLAQSRGSWREPCDKERHQKYADTGGGDNDSTQLKIGGVRALIAGLG